MNKKNWLYALLACTIAFTSLNSCKKSDDDDDTDTGPTEWVKTSAFDGDPRSGSAYFTIENTGYLTTGILKTNERVVDAWAFKNGSWTTIKNFAGSARHSAVGFSIGSVGFVGTGYDGTNALNDFYKYTPATNEWTPIESLPGEARYGAVAFTLGGKGYVGLGSTKSEKTLKDFYEYDPTLNKWTQIETKFTNKRVNAFAFVIGNKAYVGGGIDNNQFPEDFYSFDGTTWTELKPIKRDEENFTYDLTRQNAVAFTIGNYGYVVGGKKASVLSTVWKYDPSTDSWTDKHQAFQGSARESAAAFSIDGKGYVATGMNGSFKFDDNWVFTPVR